MGLWGARVTPKRRRAVPLGDVGCPIFIGRARQIEDFSPRSTNLVLDFLACRHSNDLVDASSLGGAFGTPISYSQDRKFLFPGRQQERFVWQGPRISITSTQIFGERYSDFGEAKFKKTQILKVLRGGFRGPGWVSGGHGRCPRGHGRGGGGGGEGGRGGGMWS